MQQPHEHMQTTDSNQRILYRGKAIEGLDEVTLELVAEGHEGGNGYYATGAYMQDIRLLAGLYDKHNKRTEYLFETKGPKQEVYTGLVRIGISQTNEPAIVSRLNKEHAKGIKDSFYNNTDIKKTG